MKRDLSPVYGELLFTSFFLFIAIFAYYKAMFMTSGTWYSPSIFPKLTSLLIAFLCSYELITAIRGILSAESDKLGFPRVVRCVLKHAIDKNVLFMIIMIILLALMLPMLHFTASTVIFLVVCMFFYCERKNLRSLTLYLLSSFGFVVFSLVVFRTIFKVILP